MHRKRVRKIDEQFGENILANRVEGLRECVWSLRSSTHVDMGEE